MTPNPALGILLHAIGGFAAGSFYSPLKKIRGWSWETAWLMMGLAAWLAAPWFASWRTTPELGAVLSQALSAQYRAVALAIFFGFIWGFGNLTYGMANRYLGIALGGSIAVGFCMVFGTLIPPIYDGTASRLLQTASGRTILAGIALCTFGIALCGLAGRRREVEMPKVSDDPDTKDFSLATGLFVAILAGILSACFAFGLAAGKPIAEISVAEGTNPLYSNNVVLIAVLTGGFLSNGLSCVVMNVRSRTLGDYVRLDAHYLPNTLLAWLSGVTWFCQFFFYGMGQTKIGKQFEFSSWSIHMAFIVVFLNLWGILFHEWRGTSRLTKSLVWLGILILIGSTVVIGYGNYLAQPSSATTQG
jgi:L-rhamnose-H+ transport protein